jgi:hypothetical protein
MVIKVDGKGSRTYFVEFQLATESRSTYVTQTWYRERGNIVVLFDETSKTANEGLLKSLALINDIEKQR